METMGGRRQRRLLLATALVAVLALVAALLHSSLKKQDSSADTQSVTSDLRALPEDVEAVLTSFSYSEADEGVTIKISGKSVVRRGRRVLGLRSNLVKTNFIQEIRGTVRSAKGSTSFAAARAEWDADPSRPLLLQKGVSITLPDRPLTGVKQARIYLKSGLLELDDGRSFRIK